MAVRSTSGMLDELGWQRTKEDWWRFFGSAPGAVMGIVMTVINFLFAALFIAPIASGFWQAMVALLAFLVIEAAAIISSLAYFARRTPYLQRDEARGRVRELEYALKPKVSLIPSTIVAERPNPEASFALLIVKNDGAQPIEDCYCRVVEVRWQIADGHREWEQQRYENEDLYLQWRGCEPSQTHRSFHREAVVEVVACSASGQALRVAGRQGFTLVGLDPHRLIVEVGAKNSPARLATFQLDLESRGIYRDAEGNFVIAPGQHPAGLTFVEVEK